MHYALLKFSMKVAIVWFSIFCELFIFDHPCTVGIFTTYSTYDIMVEASCIVHNASQLSGKLFYHRHLTSFELAAAFMKHYHAVLCKYTEQYLYKLVYTRVPHKYYCIQGTSKQVYKNK